jgi:hypothetical protein
MGTKKPYEKPRIYPVKPKPVSCCAAGKMG